MVFPPSSSLIFFLVRLPFPPALRFLPSVDDLLVFSPHSLPACFPPSPLFPKKEFPSPVRIPDDFVSSSSPTWAVRRKPFTRSFFFRRSLSTFRSSLSSLQVIDAPHRLEPFLSSVSDDCVDLLTLFSPPASSPPPVFFRSHVSTSTIYKIVSFSSAPSLTC